jgi:hypothetical protein
MAISAGWCDSYSSVTCCELVRASAALCDVTAASVRPVDTEGSGRFKFDPVNVMVNSADWLVSLKYLPFQSLSIIQTNEAVAV